MKVTSVQGEVLKISEMVSVQDINELLPLELTYKGQGLVKLSTSGQVSWGGVVNRFNLLREIVFATQYNSSKVRVGGTFENKTLSGLIQGTC